MAICHTISFNVRIIESGICEKLAVERPSKMKVIQQTRARRFFHNSLQSSFKWIDDEIKPFLINGPSAGWKDRVLTGHIILASLNEAFVNAIGIQQFDDWSNISNAVDRLKRVRKELIPEIEANQRPFCSVNELRKLRNDILHSTPQIDKEPIVEEKIVHRNSDGSDEMFSILRHPVEDKITLESYKRFRDDSEHFRGLILERSKLRHFDVTSHAEQSETFIEDIPD